MVRLSPTTRTDPMLSQAVRRLPLLVCSLTLCLIAVGLGRASDPLADEVQRKQLAAQKLEKEVKDVLQNAADNAKDVPASAIEILKAQRIIVAEDTNVTPERRQQLLEQIDARIK